MNETYLEALVAFFEQIKNDRQLNSCHTASATDKDVFLVLHGSICQVLLKSIVLKESFAPNRVCTPVSRYLALKHCSDTR